MLFSPFLFSFSLFQVHVYSFYWMKYYCVSENNCHILFYTCCFGIMLIVIPPQTKFERGYRGVSLSVRWLVHIKWFCPRMDRTSILGQNHLMRTNCTFLHKLLSNFAYAFIIKCRCMWHYFHVNYPNTNS